MKQAETLDITAPFPIAVPKKNVNPFDDLPFEKSREETGNNNSYLKTPEEIEAEFNLEMISSRYSIVGHIDSDDTYGRLMISKNSNTYNPDDTHSGFMEENY